MLRAAALSGFRSSGSADREVAENALLDELKRKADGLVASPDPRRTMVDDLLTSRTGTGWKDGRALNGSRTPLLTCSACSTACRPHG